MAGALAQWFNKSFRKKLLLKPMANGSFEAVDITDNEDFIQKESGSATVLSPAQIYPVSGIKNIAYIAIKQFNQATLLNPYDQNASGITEKTLWDIIEESEAHGRNMAEGTDETDKKSKQRSTITMLAAIAAAVFGLMAYVKGM